MEAVRAENAAALAKLAENEARARALRDAVRDLRAAHDAQVSLLPRCLISQAPTTRPFLMQRATPGEA